MGREKNWLFGCCVGREEGERNEEEGREEEKEI